MTTCLGTTTEAQPLETDVVTIIIPPLPEFGIVT